MSTGVLERDVRQRARERLKTSTAVAVVGAGLVGLYSVSHWGIACPFLAITGWQCPLCGGTRMAVDLASGDVAAAWQHNAVALVAVATLLIAMVWWAGQAVGLRGTARWSAPNWLSQPHVYRVVVVVAAVWTVTRNLF